MYSTTLSTIETNPENISLSKDILIYNDGIQYMFGTKQRALSAYIKQLTTSNPSIDLITYVGPAFAIGGLAIARACEEVGIRYLIVLSGPKLPRHADLLDKHKGQVFLVKGNMISTYIKEEEERQDYNFHRIELGVNNPEYKELLYSSLYHDPVLNVLYPKRVWVAAGSGTILESLMRLWPEAEFCVVTISNKYPRWIDDEPGVFHYASKLKPSQSAITPYPTVGTYDGKIWGFVKKYGERGDLIFNIAVD